MLYYTSSLIMLPPRSRTAARPVGGRAVGGRPGGPVLALDGVWRAFGEVVALGPVTLRIAAGAVCLLRGANGSGKTTLLRVAAGLLRPSGGQRHAVGPAVYLAAGDGARAAQRVADAAAFAARLGRGEPEAALRTCGLAPLARRRVAELSQGQRSRLTLAVALAAGPALLCLDEPTAHLDDAGAEVAAGAVGELAAAGTAVLLATHHPEVFDGVGDALLALRDGQLEAAP